VTRHFGDSRSNMAVRLSVPAVLRARAIDAMVSALAKPVPSERSIMRPGASFSTRVQR
jgi:hypothetical protein